MSGDSREAELQSQLDSSFRLALAYRNPDVVERFTTLLDVSPSTGCEVFEETRKWLWLCSVASKERELGIENVPDRMVIDGSLVIIDEMWHNFICFTLEYKEFCKKSFGRFIHHFPTPKRTNDKILSQIGLDPEFQTRRRRRQYEYICEKLGEATLIKWYDEFAERFTPRVVHELRLK